MNLADKMILLRKRQGWSQEELADRMQVSRQAVSKWEGNQAMPEPDRIVALSRLFGVSTDYLLKDEMDMPEIQMASAEDGLRRLTGEEAHAYLTVKRETAPRIALGVLLCVISPAALILLSGYSQVRPINQGLMVGIGVTVLLLLVAAAVGLFISCGMKTADYEWMDKEVFAPGEGVTELAQSLRLEQRERHTRNIIAGVALCIVSVIPVVLASLMAPDTLLVLAAVGLLLLLIGLGAAILVLDGVYWTALQRVLQEGDYTPERKRYIGLAAMLSGTYWFLMTVIFLSYSFIGNDWDHSWIIWPVAGVAFAAVRIAFWQKEKRKNGEG
ncbi:MAG: helix-turn-helix transcriptional regulator [Clostridia bacterium]|nr:helix-turn-helix transcriptional regulator [Clostridia bacterium]